MSYSRKDVLDFYDYRRMLETMCLRAAMDANALPLAQMQAAIDQMQTLAEHGETIDVPA